jgi:ketosteroid isomerase-like protein
MPTIGLNRTRADEIEALDSLNQHFICAVRTSDASWLDEYLDQDFVNANSDGSLTERAAFLAQVAQPFPLLRFSVNDVRIRIIGDSAIVHGRTAYLRPDQCPGEGRYTDVWVRRSNGWRCVAAHSTRG